MYDFLLPTDTFHQSLIVFKLFYQQRNAYCVLFYRIETAASGCRLESACQSGQHVDETDFLVDLFCVGNK